MKLVICLIFTLLIMRSLYAAVNTSYLTREYVVVKVFSGGSALVLINPSSKMSKQIELDKEFTRKLYLAVKSQKQGGVK